MGSVRVRRHPQGAIDQPHSAASPAVPALMGPGPYIRRPTKLAHLGRQSSGTQPKISYATGRVGVRLWRCREATQITFDQEQI